MLCDSEQKKCCCLRAQRPFRVTWQLTGPRDPGASGMFCEKAMELVRELHRAPEGQLPAFNVRSGGGEGRVEGQAWGLRAGPHALGRGLCPRLLAGDVFSNVSSELSLPPY